MFVEHRRLFTNTIPETENTNGLKAPCSMFMTRLLHWRFFLSEVSLEFWLMLGDSENWH